MFYIRLWSDSLHFCHFENGHGQASCGAFLPRSHNRVFVNDQKFTLRRRAPISIVGVVDSTDGFEFDELHHLSIFRLLGSLGAPPRGRVAAHLRQISPVIVVDEGLEIRNSVHPRSL